MDPHLREDDAGFWLLIHLINNLRIEIFFEKQLNIPFPEQLNNEHMNNELRSIFHSLILVL